MEPKCYVLYCNTQSWTYRRFLLGCSQAQKSVHLTTDHCLLQHLNSVAAHSVTMWCFTHALLPQRAGAVQAHAGLRRHDSLQAGSSASQFVGNMQSNATLYSKSRIPKFAVTFQMLLGSRSRPAGQAHSNWWSHGSSWALVGKYHSTWRHHPEW
jgi:hypothetical protein